MLNLRFKDLISALMKHNSRRLMSTWILKKRQESINNAVIIQYGSCTMEATVLLFELFDLVPCQLFGWSMDLFQGSCHTSFSNFPPFFTFFSHLSYVVITILPTDGFDGTDIKSSEDLWAGINPKLIPVTKRSLCDNLTGLDLIKVHIKLNVQ